MATARGVSQQRKSRRRLEDTIHSVLGLKENLTPAWAECVCHIVKNLASAGKFEESTPGVTNQQSAEGAISLDENANTRLSIEIIRGDLADLRYRLVQSNLERRQALNELLDLKGNIRVFCRVRPFLPYEGYNKPEHVVVSDVNNVLLSITGSKRKQYTFDRVFHPSITQEEVFSEIEPMIKSALDGYNICIFAYGQTGTGKTYSMEGRLDSPGIVPRAMEMLFGHTLQGNQNLHMTFSMLEIYMGSLRDLLAPRRDKLMTQSKPSLTIQTDPDGGTDIENLVAIKVDNFMEVKQIYGVGMRSRSTATTLANATSSRSHCLIRISITCPDAPERRRKTNKMWLIDLGGSERLLKTQAKGRRLEEGKAINLSLSALADVISALQRKKTHVPYRNSKLTQVLRDSLGEDSKALMVVHVSPKEEDLCETVCSLCFATRVRSTHLGNENLPEARENKEARISLLLQKIQDYERECESLTRKIQKHMDTIHDLNGHPSDQQLPVLSVLSEYELSGMKADTRFTKDTMHVLKGVPSFMRPTISSRRRLVPDHPTRDSPGKKVCSKSKRKKSASVYAESMIQNTESNLQSGYGTEISISRTTSLDWKCGLDNETECSLDALDCEIKTVIHAEQEISRDSSVASMEIESISTNKSCAPQTINGEMYQTVGNWIQAYSQRSKRVIDVPERYKRPTEENDSITNNEADISSNEVEQEGLGSEVYFDCSCKELHHDDNDRQTTLFMREHSPEMKFLQNIDVLTDGMNKQQLKSQEETFLMDKTFSGSNNQTLPTYDDMSKNQLDDITDENDSNKHFDGNEECGVKIHTMRNLSKSRRMLQFPDELGEKKNSGLDDCKLSAIKKELHHVKGPWQLLAQIIQICVSSILLGLGLKSLGLGHKFFQGLTI